MAFQVSITTSNGYRCGCCSRDWDYSSWVDTLEEALAMVPTELIDGEPHPYNGDCELTKVEVVDGSTGEVVAWGRASWSTGYGRGSGYKFTHWSGYRPDTESFSVVYSGRNKVVDRTWSEVIDELAAKKREADLRDAERKRAEAQAVIDRLQGSGTAKSA